MAPRSAAPAPLRRFQTGNDSVVLLFLLASRETDFFKVTACFFFFLYGNIGR